MKKKFKLGIIGCGLMGECVLRGVILSDFLAPKKIVVSDISVEKLDSIGELNVFTCESDKYVAENSEFLVFAVKPRDFNRVVKSLGGFVPEKVISLMAGISKNTIKNSLGVGAVKVARCIPNLPCTIGSGVTGVDMVDFNGNTDDTEFISKVFDCLGTVVSISDSKIDAVSALGGSGPAYAFMFLDALIDAGVKQGLSKGEAKIFAAQTVMGAAELVLRDEKEIPELLMQVCGSGSASVEGVKSLETDDFRGTVGRAVEAGARRAKELSEE